jgi:pyridoxal phosphate enzyme (YggS family)
VTIADNWQAIKARVEAACERAGRDPRTVTIVAVSKKHPVSAIREALAAGVTELGENYAQELVAKRAELRHCTDAHWHFIGRLQRNKAKFVAGQCALIHAVDNVELARELAKRRPDQTRVQPILLALSGEASKAGVHAQTALDTARELITVEGVRLDGLMTMPPPADDPEASRPAFEDLRALREQLQQALGHPLPALSMGMSDDFEVAIACGATHVRIGTAIFGARSTT